MTKQLNSLLQIEMSRKEFLATMGFGPASLAATNHSAATARARTAAAKTAPKKLFLIIAYTALGTFRGLFGVT
jgi:hypothetical protein